MPQEDRLVVVSNRTPSLLTINANQATENAQAAGGLVSALYATLQERSGVWFGWDGRTTHRQQHEPVQRRRVGHVELATVALSKKEVSDSYIGFCNRTLWPLFHGFPTHIQFRATEYRTYRNLNCDFAVRLLPLLAGDELVWVHDYHLIPLGAALRNLGWQGRLGFFLHIPFPAADIFSILPCAKQILEDLVAYDLVGFHTQRYRHNCVEAMDTELGGIYDGEAYHQGQVSVRLGVYPIGTDPSTFARWAQGPGATQHQQHLRQLVHGRQIILGVDRLDYTKGIVERLLAFERLLVRYPSWREQVSLVQISAPSRTRIPEYRAHKHEIDRLVANINSRFSGSDWIPVHHLYRAYSQQVLAAYYREAEVCLVTPLRDGMNLVAKEYIASQTMSPGVLILSKFCGAAEDLQEAIIINPYDIASTVQALNTALRMPLRERRERWLALHKRVHTRTAHTWSARFLSHLSNGKGQKICVAE